MAKDRDIRIENRVELEASFKIAGQIASFLTGELTPEEQQELETWRDSCEENRLLFEKIVSEENAKRKKEMFRSFQVNMGWEDFRMRKNKAKQFRVIRIAIRCVAVLTLFLGGGYYFISSRTVEVPRYVKYSFQPGTTRAHLVLASGEVVDLETHHGQIGMTGEAKVENLCNQLIYEEAVNQIEDSKEEVYNEIHVPRCGEYQLKLSDGTLVFLNSMTSLRYPVRFNGKTREIELQGEAYFKVARNVEKPFIVKTAGQSIRVLGTEFNVASFEDEKCIKTTLVRGSVQVDGGGRVVVLKPNEQLIYNKSTNDMQVEQVDVSYSTAWKDGLFRFRDARLEEIMQTVKRWYDVDVEYADPETKDYIFGLNFNRNELIDPVLRIFEANGKVKITTMGKKLIIKKGR